MVPGTFRNGRKTQRSVASQNSIHCHIVGPFDVQVAGIKNRYSLISMSDGLALERAELSRIVFTPICGPCLLTEPTHWADPSGPAPFASCSFVVAISRGKFDT